MDEGIEKINNDIFKKTKKKHFVFLKKYHFYKISNNKYKQ